MDGQEVVNEFGAYDPGSAFEGIEPTPAPTNEPVQTGETPVQQQVAQPELLDFGGRKIPALNEDLAGLHKDYIEQQRYITSLQEQVKAFQQIAQMQQTQPQQQPTSEPPQVIDKEAWFETFYDNGQSVVAAEAEKVVKEYLDKVLSEKVEPILQERQWNQEINKMYEQFPDFENLIGDVQQLVNQFPEKYADRPGGLEEAYYRAKATRLAQPPAPQQLAQDPAVQQQVMQNYFTQKQQTNEQIPNTMQRGGGFTPQAPQASPTTLREASRQFMKTMGYR